MGQTPLPFNNKAVCLQLHDFSFLVCCSETFQPCPHPSSFAVSTGISTAVGALQLRGGLPGLVGEAAAAPARDLRIPEARDPPLARLRPRPAAASPSALIKTCEMERLARAAPFYLQHLSCC